MWICYVSESWRVLAFNCKTCLALEAPVIAKMLSFSRPLQQIVRPHRRFHRILLSSSSQPIAGSTQNASTAVAVNLPLHSGKYVGPTPVLAVLGIELDSLAQVARLPEGKLQALKELIHSWLPRKWCSRRELNLSLAPSFD